jgi:hypothetical protein
MGLQIFFHWKESRIVDITSATTATSPNKFQAHTSDGMIRIFKELPHGLYYSDTNICKTGTLLINTVEGNKSKYHNCDYAHAILAQKTQQMIGRPSTHSFLAIVENKLLPNCPVTRWEIAIAEDIFGPNIGSLKGKTVWSAATAINIVGLLTYLPPL